MILLASTPSAGETWLSWVLVVAAVLASGLLMAGPALRRRYPVAWRLACGFPAVCLRVGAFLLGGASDLTPYLPELVNVLGGAEGGTTAHIERLDRNDDE